MTKAQLLQAIASQTGRDTRTVSDIFESAFDIIKVNMISGNAVTIRGFGTFGRVKKAQKTARNIKAGTALIVPAHFAPSITFGKEIKEEVRAGGSIED